MEIDTIKSLKKRLINNIEKLPETDMHEALDFIEFLLKKKSKERVSPKVREVDLTKDPILRLMGIADLEPFSNDIDQELYGQ